MCGSSTSTKMDLINTTVWAICYLKLLLIQTRLPRLMNWSIQHFIKFLATSMESSSWQSLLRTFVRCLREWRTLVPFMAILGLRTRWLNLVRKWPLKRSNLWISQSWKKSRTQSTWPSLSRLSTCHPTWHRTCSRSNDSIKMKVAIIAKMTT